MALTPDQIAAANAGSVTAAAKFNAGAITSGPTTTPSGAVVDAATGQLITPPAAATTPINRTVDTSTTPNSDPTTAEGYLNTFTPPQSEADIAEQKRVQAQSQIDALNKTYDDQVAAEQQAGQQRLAKNNAVSVLSGLTGSSEAVASDNTVSAANAKAIGAINDQRSNALQAIYGNIDNAAANEAEQQEQDATKSAEDILARRTQNQTDAVNNLKLIAGSGETYDNFKANASPQAYQSMLNAFGGSEDALKGYFALNKPQASILNQGIAPDGHTYYVVSKDPISGATTTDHFDLGFSVPQGSNTIQLGGGSVMFVPKDGIDLSKPLDGQVQIYNPTQGGSSGSGSGSGSGSASTSSGDTSKWLADFYGSGGQVALPALGIGNAAASTKLAILNGIAQSNQELGISGSQFAAIISDKNAASKALTQISKNQGLMTVAEGTASKNFDLLATQLGNLPPETINPLLNQFIQTGAIQTGDPNVKPIADALTLALNEYAKVITGQTGGAAVSDSARAEAQKMLSTADTTQTILNFISLAEQEMSNRAASYDDAKQQIFQTIQNAHGEVDTGDTSTSTDTSDSDPLGLGI